jgi:hypothetical protein
MPGFNLEQGGQTNRDKYNKAEFRRKHRWRVAEGGPTDLAPASWLYLQKCSRPSFKYNEAIVHHDQEQAYFAGKQEWETITFTFYDVEMAGGDVGDISNALYQWVAGGLSDGQVAEHQNAKVAKPDVYKKKLILQMTDGSGDDTEEWELKGAWPQSVNWLDLDYTNTEVQLIEVVIRYDRAVKTK